jgi:hypothetical protein
MPEKPKSGLNLHFNVQTEDGKVLDIQTSMADVLVWERLHNGTSWLADNTITGVIYLAWIAGKRLGLVEGIDQAGWAATVVDYQILDEDAESAETAVDPTQPAR